MAEPHIFVATPLGKNGMLHIGTASFCASVSLYPNVEWGFTMTHSAEMSRNVLIQKRLEDDDGKTTHFLFVDSDIAAPQDMLQRMLALDADFVTVPTPLFFDKKMVWNVGRPDNDGWFMMSDELPDKPFITPKTGGGAILIKREVMEKVGWPWFKTEYMPMNEDNKCLKCGEDVWFCERAKEEGFEITVIPNMACHHYNQVDLLEIYNSIVAQIEEKIKSNKGIK
jgi:GT2 family glycosyltransferase